MEIKNKLIGRTVRVGLFIKDTKTGKYTPAGYKKMRVRVNACIPDSHKLLQ